MAGGDVDIGIDKSAPGGVVVTALEIIEPGFLDTLVAGELIFDLWDTPIQLQIIPDVGRRNGPRLFRAEFARKHYPASQRFPF